MKLKIAAGVSLTPVVDPVVHPATSSGPKNCKGHVYGGYGINFFMQKAAKKKGVYPLHPGVQGFFITYDDGRERQASHEAIDVIGSEVHELSTIASKEKRQTLKSGTGHVEKWCLNEDYVKELSKFINHANEIKAATAANKGGGQLSIVKPAPESTKVPKRP